MATEKKAEPRPLRPSKLLPSTSKGTRRKTDRPTARELNEVVIDDPELIEEIRRQGREQG